MNTSNESVASRIVVWLHLQMSDETTKQRESPRRVYGERGLYKPKNELDGFLRAYLGGKYKYRRYEIFEDYLIRSEGKTPEIAKQTIEIYKAYGLAYTSVYYALLIEGLRKWKQKCRKERSDKAIRTRWNKKPPKNPDI